MGKEREKQEKRIHSKSEWEHSPLAISKWCSAVCQEVGTHYCCSEEQMT